MKKPILLCGGSQGRAVVFGWVDEYPVKGEAVTLTDARMVLYWSEGCGGLLGLAAKGPFDGTRLTDVVARVSDTQWQQYVEVSSKASEALGSWPAV